MKKIIPSNNHVMRHVSPSRFDNGKVLGTAFYLRPQENGLSVSWKEYYSTEIQISLPKVRAELGRKRTVSKNHKLALLNVGKTKDYLSKESKLEFFQNTNEIDSHALVTGYTPEDTYIADMIAETILDIYNAA